MKTVLFLIISNVFMTIAWYGGLINQSLQQIQIWKLILISWGIAFIEYCFMIPANNRFAISEGYNPFQLKSIQEIISLTTFSLFAIIVLHQPLRWNHILAFILIGIAAYLIFLPESSSESIR